MKSISTIFLFIACVSAFTIIQNNLEAISWPFTVCGKGKWTPQSLTLNAVPTKNSNNNIELTGTADDDTSFTNVDLTVKLNGVFLHSQTIDFKQSYGAGDTVDFKYTNFVPGFAPSGTYGLTFNFKSGKNDNGCVGFTFKLA